MGAWERLPVSHRKMCVVAWLVELTYHEKLPIKKKKKARILVCLHYISRTLKVPGRIHGATD